MFHFRQREVLAEKTHCQDSESRTGGWKKKRAGATWTPSQPSNHSEKAKNPGHGQRKIKRGILSDGSPLGA